MCALLVYTQQWHGSFSHDRVQGVQRMHMHAVSRIGGLAIFLSALAINYWQDGSHGFDFTATMLMMGFIVFSFGFVEDLSQKVGIALRMWVSLLPGFMVYFLTVQ